MNTIRYFYFNNDYSLTEVEQFVFRTEWLSPFTMILINDTYKLYDDATKAVTSNDINDIYKYLFRRYVAMNDIYKHFEYTVIDGHQEVIHEGYEFHGEFICGILGLLNNFFAVEDITYWSAQKPTINKYHTYKIWVQEHKGHALKSTKWTWGLRNISKCMKEVV
jgi:hypothetical protein